MFQPRNVAPALVKSCQGISVARSQLPNAPTLQRWRRNVVQVGARTTSISTICSIAFNVTWVWNSCRTVFGSFPLHSTSSLYNWYLVRLSELVGIPAVHFCRTRYIIYGQSLCDMRYPCSWRWSVVCPLRSLFSNELGEGRWSLDASEPETVFLSCPMLGYKGTEAPMGAKTSR